MSALLTALLAVLIAAEPRLDLLPIAPILHGRLLDETWRELSACTEAMAAGEDWGAE